MPGQNQKESPQGEENRIKNGSLVIVESPAKAKTISKFMGKGYNVLASNGHVRDLPQSQLGVDTQNGFQPRYVTMKGRGEILERLKEQAKSASQVFLATDPDREGEAISWHIATALKIPLDEARRIEFNEITQQAIKRALENPRTIDMNLVNAQQARRILDRLVGYKISPILWKKVRKGLSAGRVQSVATRIICDRENEIQAFVPREFWSIDALLSQPKSKKAFTAKFYGDTKKKMELADESAARKVLQGLQDAVYKVADVKKGNKTRHAAPPYTTSTLQQEASRRYGFTASRTMLIAQQLYEGIDIKGQGAAGLVTYIRTDSVRVASEAQAEAADHIRQTYGNEYVPSPLNQYRGKKGIQDAHEAIRPTSLQRSPASIKDSLTNDQYKLYKMIYDRFIASQMAEAVYDTLTVSIEANGYVFRSNGLKIVFPGFTAAYKEVNDQDDDSDDVILPSLEPGEVLDLQKLVPEQHFTQPPSRYTEATLVKALEEKGIGRPSTYAPIISTIIERGYVVRENKYLFPTDLGKVVTELMKEHFDEIVDIEFTAGMEEKLDDIEDGGKQWQNVLAEFYQPFESQLVQAEKNMEKVKLPDEVSQEVCPSCGSQMIIKSGRFGKFLACPRYPECKTTKPLLEKLDVPCPDCGKTVLKLRSSKGKTYFKCEDTGCKYISWYAPVAEKCPKCGGNMVLKWGRNNRAYRQCTNEACKERSFASDKKKASDEQG